MNITSKSLFMWWNNNYKYFIDYPHDPSCKVFYKFPIHKYIHVLILESLKDPSIKAWKHKSQH
jgi:hypothetical protein